MKLDYSEEVVGGVLSRGKFQHTPVFEGVDLPLLPAIPVVIEVRLVPLPSVLQDERGGSGELRDYCWFMSGLDGRGRDLFLLSRLLDAMGHDFHSEVRVEERLPSWPAGYSSGGVETLTKPSHVLSFPKFFLRSQLGRLVTGRRCSPLRESKQRCRLTGPRSRGAGRACLCDEAVRPRCNSTKLI